MHFYVQITHLTFRKRLIGGWRQPANRKRPRSADGDIARMNGLFHEIAKGKYWDCTVCSDRSKPKGRKRTNYYCQTCPSNPPLCVENCFNKYHQVSKFHS